MTHTLNHAQRTAVEASDGPVLVLAGAGSGKTRVIVERIRWLIEERGVDPRQVLALTFTNKAANEMRTRVADSLRVDRLASFMGTFHSFGLSILRREMDRLDRSKSFTVFDDGDQLTLMKRLAKSLPDRFAPVSPREALAWISKHKSELCEMPAGVESSPETETFRELWSRYHEALERSSAVDFDDLLVLPVRLFREYPQLRDRYGDRFRYVLVDEYQDTNRAQYEFLRLLVGESGNVFVVGDEDQAIYSWRGADIRNILEFETDFPGAQVVRLEENYRSTQPILTAANAVVSQNVDRLGKVLQSVVSGGVVPEFHGEEDARAEADHVVQTIKKNTLPPADTAVLFRTNNQARALEEALTRHGVPYRTIGLVRFYARQEIKHLLCYLRLAVNPGDDEAVLRVLNVPARGIGAVSVAQIRKMAEEAGTPLQEVIQQLSGDDSATARLREGAADFCGVVSKLTARGLEGSVSDVVEWLVERLDFEAWMKHAHPDDYRTRLEHIEEFLNACREYDAEIGKGLGDFLHELTLDSSVEQTPAGDEGVALLTCHSAKGLEFDHVFIVGLEEGLMPHGASMDDERRIEEERRLCYVAMTRARKTLYLSAARQRMVHGETLHRKVSRFMDSVPEVLIRRPDASTGIARDVQVQRAGSEGLKTGIRVRHAKFGPGTVMFTSGTGSSAKVRIRFDRGGSKQFLVRAAPLEIVKGKQR